MKTKKLSIKEQIHKFETDGVTFNFISKEETEKILTTKVYFFKLKVFEKAFEKNTATNKYLRLDFKNLIDLFDLDCMLKKFILDLSITVEHNLKLRLINKVTNNPLEDGKTIAESFLEDHPDISSELDDRAYHSDLVAKYKGNWTIWSLCEVLSLRSFGKLYTFYLNNYPDRDDNLIVDLFYPLRFLRNGAAHNLCLLSSIRVPFKLTEHEKNSCGEIVPTKRLLTYLNNADRNHNKSLSISNEAKKNILKNPLVHDFVASLVLFKISCDNSETTERIRLSLKQLISVFSKHHTYISNDSKFSSIFNLIINTVDFLF